MSNDQPASMEPKINPERVWLSINCWPDGDHQIPRLKVILELKGDPERGDVDRELYNSCVGDGVTAHAFNLTWLFEERDQLRAELAEWKAKYIEARKSGYDEGLSEANAELERLKAVFMASEDGNEYELVRLMKSENEKLREENAFLNRRLDDFARLNQLEREETEKLRAEVERLKADLLKDAEMLADASIMTP